MNLSRLLMIWLIIGTATSCADRGHDQVTIVPEPYESEHLKGSYLMDNPARVSFPGDVKELAEIFFEDARTLAGLLLEEAVEEDADIRIALDPGLEYPEGYTLQIDRNGIILTGKDLSGLYYGMQTLLQVFSQSETYRSSVKVPALSIKDHPAFSWRGMHLDVSRHFFPVEFIKKYIDILSYYKLNTFHWHLTDDQGWRIEMKKFPELTEKGAYREDTRDRPWSYEQFPVKPGKPVYGGFYTQDEVRQIIKYAALRGITIVPEIDIPGHSWAALFVYPELSCSGKPFFKDPSVPFEFTDPFCAGKEATFDFLCAVFDEIIGLFPSAYIHIGGDEAKKTPWETCPDCQRRMKKNGLDDVEELQSYFIKRITDHIESRGRKVIGWDEILEGGLAEGAAVMSWRGEEGGIHAAQAGHYAVMTPGSHLYLNSNQDMTRSENTRVITLEKVYGYDPVPEVLSEEESKHILGVQGCLWTENTQTPEQAERKILPRLMAISEIAWACDSRPSFEAFKQKLQCQFHILDNMNVDYFIEPPHGLEKENAFIEKAALVLYNPLGFGSIHYTLNGGDPGEADPVWTEAVQVSDDAIVKAVTILPSGKRSEVCTGKFYRMAPISGITGEFSEGVTVEYAEGSLTSLDGLDGLEVLRVDTLPGIRIPDYVSEDHFALVFRGFMRFTETAVYTLTTISDDGTRLFIHDSLLVDNDGIHGPVRVSGQIALESGFHPFELQFFEGNYGQQLELEIKKGEKRVEPEYFSLQN